ncbi:hypothetical protein GCM10011376_20430 [Nocardioides flavus (ex Wang et al. 2016)]|uniref:PASTA domain-containing protein n=1 Tax=Nocardioides flavus (ex Wang et al. 2016) TaxID=2058780 RepID=A0ABQ3HKJ9_9ACTN|nr:hypothetical protein [Nocardioides flavus (ex Wang et al. 2016)]GHE17433.1 hypothetical protein GCM10011376_20430 [Nocardioides flavus (ex Wang et al. 2016)]
MTTQTPVPDELDAFETRLLVELRREVATTPSTEAAPSSVRTRRRALAVAAGVAATAVLAVVLVPGLGTTPVYSVQEGNAGEIEVEINRPEDAAGLERALEEHGIEADITYLPDLQGCAPGRYTEVGRDVRLSLSIGDDLVRVTLPPGAVRDGETFVMVLSMEAMTQEQIDEVWERDGQRVVDGSSSSVTAEVASGAVGACEIVPASG